jgi:predicted acylesterase/phospholipase RssA
MNTHNKKDDLYDPDINLILDNEIGTMLNRETEHVKEILVLSGGGTKGVAQLGALHCLKKHNMLNDIKTIAATSAGSIMGMLWCCGYQPMEIFKFIKLINLDQTKKIETQNVITKYGLDDGSRMILVLSKLMTARTFSPDVRFKEFYKRTKINLIVTGACINDKKIYYFSHTSYPEMKVLDAVRISISIPIIFTPCVFEGKIFVDGCCIDNFPIHLFDNEIDKVIGIHVTEARSVVKEIKFIEDYLTNTMQCLFEGLAHRDVRAYHKHIIQIRCTEASESPENLINMFDEGFDAAQKKIDSDVMVK